MSNEFENSLNVILIKNILSGIPLIDSLTNFNELSVSSKHDDFVNFIDGTQVDMKDKSVVTNVKVINENILSSTNSVSNFSNLPNNIWPSSFSGESVYNDNYNDLYQIEDEENDFLEQKQRQLEIMFSKDISLAENKISGKEIKVTSSSTGKLIENPSFITSCIKRQPIVCYDYSCKTRNPPSKRVELLTPVKEKKWFEDYKMELQFLQENFSEVLPEILYDVVRKRVTDPVHYIVHYLIKYKVDKLKNFRMHKHLS